VLVAAGSPVVQVNEWPRDEIVPMLAHTIDAEMTETAAASGLAESNFVVSMVDERGEGLSTKTFSVRRQTDPLDTPLSAAAQLNGTQESWMIQMQRFCESTMRMNMTGMAAQMEVALRLIVMLSDKVLDSENRVDAARELAHELREAWLESLDPEARQRESESTEITPAQREWLDLVKSNIPGIMQVIAAKMSARGSGDAT